MSHESGDSVRYNTALIEQADTIRAGSLRELAETLRCMSAAAAACGTGTTVGIWDSDVDRIGAHAQKLINELFPMPPAPPAAAQDEATTAPEGVSEDEYHVLRILGNGQISAAKARELIKAIRRGNRPDLPLFEAEVRVPSEIDALVSRFLAWPLPKSVCSDLCVTHPDYEFPRSGTNLLTADEARQMIEYLMAPAPNAHHPGPRCGCRECKGEFG